jgi:hypothetical protein
MDRPVKWPKGGLSPREGLPSTHMATHDVTVDLPTRFVLHSDVTFVVWSDDAKLGELQVSKGSIDWLPGNGRTRYRMRWEEFSDFMKREGRARPR